MKLTPFTLAVASVTGAFTALAVTAAKSKAAKTGTKQEEGETREIPIEEILPDEDTAEEIAADAPSCGEDV